MQDTAVRARVLGRLQHDLQSIYRVDSPLKAADFAIGRGEWTGETSEELLVRECEGDLEVALFVDDEVLREIDQPSGKWTASRLQAHCLAVEGVSHFLYLTNRARLPRPVSQLELELQAEIDKFVTVLLMLWESGRRESAPELRSRLFERVSFHGAAQDRYRKASSLAGLYCRFLEAKYVMSNSVEGLLADLRRMYRLGAGDKLSYAAQGAAL